MHSLENPIVTLIKNCRLADREGRLRVSDIHITPGLSPRMRVDGKLMLDKHEPFEKSVVDEFIDHVAPSQSGDLASGRRNFTAQYSSTDTGQCRIHVQMAHTGKRVVIRLLHDRIPRFEELNLPPIIETFANLPNGLVLVTGGTGSGKSTTLAALVDKINRTREEAIYTVEDPIEYLHTPQMSDVVHMSVGADTPSFDTAITSMLRLDPDVMLVGEIRTWQTAQACIQAAESGHLCLATVHTNSAAETVGRIINMFPAENQNQITAALASSLKAVVAQKLVPKIDGKGRLAVAEVLIVDTAVKTHIMSGKFNQLYSHIDSNRKAGMTTLEQSLLAYVRAGRISRDAALEYANDRDKLLTALQNAA
jgi:twitching motility protein PilT